jgi:hypothetical protein
MASAWIDHIRDFAKRNGMTYGCALSDPRCRQEYKKKAVPSTEKKAKGRKKNNGITFTTL